MLEHKIADMMIVPDRTYCEMHEEGDACDVIVRMENGAMYTALFATISYVHRQMDLTLMVTESIPETPPVRYAVVDTPHIIVDDLERGIIEDTIDNLVAQDVFESLFTRVTRDAAADNQRTSSDGERTTQEIAAAVIEEVLVVIGD
ncbi:MAG: hypothetical protein OXN94_06885 [Chloroflexota bacterium]|nr:hypothetical protein [Chloroflexota bacterium]MDE2857558.1 hypothetical protein [Chloroflexota bacterium]MDE2950245.1 hypothetical protein [Chloroflexota bacterium]